MFAVKAPEVFELTKLISAALTDPASDIVTASFPKAETVPATLASYKALTSDKEPVIAVALAVTNPAVLASIALRSPASIDVSVTVTAYSLDEEVSTSSCALVESASVALQDQ